LSTLFRIVLDTNIILSGLLYGGAPSTLIRLGQTGNIELFTSLFILEELSRILLRSKFDKRIHESGLSVAELVGTFAKTAILVEPQPIPRTAPDPTTTSSSPPPSPRRPIPSSPAPSRCSPWALTPASKS
jgi:putative PIN family toxin of toxin-antitoxin system